MLKRLPFIYIIVLLFLFLISTSCVSSNSVDKNPIAKSPDQPMIVLFSDENSLYKEANYYDALLELQNLYADKKIPFQFVFSHNKEAVEYFNITTFPTLIIIDTDDTILLRMENSYLKEEIVAKILNVIENKEQIKQKLDHNE